MLLLNDTITVTTYFNGEFIGSRRKQIYITASWTFTVSIYHSGVNLVKVSLGNFAQYLRDLKY